MIVMVMTNSVKNILRTLLDSKREDIHKVFKLEGKIGQANCSEYFGCVAYFQE